MLERCADDAAILTGIGVGTAFGLLVAMIFVILAVRLLSARVLPALGERLPGRSSETEARNKAVAAVVAVTTLMANRDRTGGRRAGSAADTDA